MVKTISVALLGNPNTGKSSVFNTLTGLKQTVGNYPGVTVEKKIGSFAIDRTTSVQLIDLPGTYGLNTQSIDQSIVFELLLNKNKIFEYSHHLYQMCILLWSLMRHKKMHIILEANFYIQSQKSLDLVQ